MKTIILAALTADGLIGQDSSHLSTTWTTKSDKELFMHLAKESRCLIMGMNTFLTTARKAPSVFTKSIPGRRLIVYTRHPEKAEGYPEVETTGESPRELVKRLEAEGVEKALVTGGAQVYRMFMLDDLVDELYLSIQPILFGTGVHLLDSPLSVPLELIDTQIEPADSTAILHYRIKRD
ncbi:MAG TPA: dihydrofolate reductase family protein [Candidatus Saccharimonadia bacterium]|jgi:dihydrofolate reductase